ncbi:3-demethylubiquinone-9 3-methyltransferase-like protein [Babesia caballi]|uniref:3-demethylubiquinone-9 3-methyltransferase-like protein n=1 Tax=Babesia caballi TaxID=5871 RepID=A0AAV4LVH6_BABCB|nr:3-demethylubiquinone-9 3-methyltransferase-like protein [Babesia caballi]
MQLGTPYRDAIRRTLFLFFCADHAEDSLGWHVHRYSTTSAVDAAPKLSAFDEMNALTSWVGDLELFPAADKRPAQTTANGSHPATADGDTAAYRIIVEEDFFAPLASCVGDAVPERLFTAYKQRNRDELDEEDHVDFEAIEYKRAAESDEDSESDESDGARMDPLLLEFQHYVALRPNAVGHKLPFAKLPTGSALPLERQPTRLGRRPRRRRPMPRLQRRTRLRVPAAPASYETHEPASAPQGGHAHRVGAGVHLPPRLPYRHLRARGARGRAPVRLEGVVGAGVHGPRKLDPQALVEYLFYGHLVALAERHRDAGVHVVDFGRPQCHRLVVVLDAHLYRVVLAPLDGRVQLRLARLELHPRPRDRLARVPLGVHRLGLEAEGGFLAAAQVGDVRLELRDVLVQRLRLRLQLRHGTLVLLRHAALVVAQNRHAPVRLVVKVNQLGHVAHVDRHRLAQVLPLDAARRQEDAPLERLGHLEPPQLLAQRHRGVVRPEDLRRQPHHELLQVLVQLGRRDLVEDVQARLLLAELAQVFARHLVDGDRVEVANGVLAEEVQRDGVGLAAELNVLHAQAAAPHRVRLLRVLLSAHSQRQEVDEVRCRAQLALDRVRGPHLLLVVTAHGVDVLLQLARLVVLQKVVEPLELGLCRRVHVLELVVDRVAVVGQPRDGTVVEHVGPAVPVPLEHVHLGHRRVLGQVQHDAAGKHAGLQQPLLRVEAAPLEEPRRLHAVGAHLLADPVHQGVAEALLLLRSLLLERLVVLLVLLFVLLLVVKVLLDRREVAVGKLAALHADRVPLGQHVDEGLPEVTLVNRALLVLRPDGLRPEGGHLLQVGRQRHDITPKLDGDAVRPVLGREDHPVVLEVLPVARLVLVLHDLVNAAVPVHLLPPAVDGLHEILRDCMLLPLLHLHLDARFRRQRHQVDGDGRERRILRLDQHDFLRRNRTWRVSQTPVGPFTIPFVLNELRGRLALGSGHLRGCF